MGTDYRAGAGTAASFGGKRPCVGAKTLHRISGELLPGEVVSVTNTGIDYIAVEIDDYSGLSGGEPQYAANFVDTTDPDTDLTSDDQFCWDPKYVAFIP